MPTSKDIATYPQWMFEVCEQVARGAQAVELDFADAKQAIMWRQRFYAFRMLLVEPGMRAAANTVTVRAVGRTLMFLQVDSAAPTMRVHGGGAGLVPANPLNPANPLEQMPSMSSELTDLDSTVDMTEQATADLLGMKVKPREDG